jgi:hypothetical protein
MRACLLPALIALGSCSHAEPAPVAPKGPTACARAADAMVRTMLDQLSHKDAVPTEQADAFRRLISERCEADAWAPEATRCLAAMKTTADAAPCAAHLTEAQQAALVQDEQGLLGAPKNPESNQGSGTPAAPQR